jgi:hypothetical protein
LQVGDLAMQFGIAIDESLEGAEAVRQAFE